MAEPVVGFFIAGDASLIVVRRLLLALSVLLAAFAIALLLTGGFVVSVSGARVSARSPTPTALGAALALAGWAVLAARARAARQDLAAIEVWLAAHARTIVLSIAGAAAAVAIAFGSFSAAGSDASGYLSYSAVLKGGELGRDEPLAAVADWPNAGPTIVALGWRLSADPGRHVPSYPIGLPLLMLPFDRIGGAVAASLVPPLALLVAIWATAMLADRIGGPVAAIVAAVWLATSPVALIEAMQPMSDVPATAAWLMCWAGIVARPRQTAGRSARGWAFGAGVAAGVAAMIRPNLAPLAAVPALYVLFAPDPFGLPAADRVRRAAWFSTPVVVAGILIAYLQWRLFGSALESGHGTAAALYSPSSFATNAVVYTRWLVDTHGPWLLIAPLAVFVVRERLMHWLLVFAALVVLAYLIYGTFEVWTYLRFLLPALAIAMVAATAIATRLIAALPESIRGAGAVVLALLLAAGNINAAQAHGVFQLGRRDGRALVVGHYLEAAAPARAVFIAGEESGALRYYTGRSIVRWDVLSADALDRAVERLRGRGYEIWIVLDAWEEELFRRKFSASPIGTLDWPPQLEAGTAVRTRAWRLRDRAAFHNGGMAQTDRLQ